MSEAPLSCFILSARSVARYAAAVAAQLDHCHKALVCILFECSAELCVSHRLAKQRPDWAFCAHARCAAAAERGRMVMSTGQLSLG